MVELHIEPLVTVADLLIAIGLIGLGLSILAIIITVEICYFRGGKNESNRSCKDHG
jgi:hypothetical protein